MAAAKSANQPQWGNGGPDNAGTYNSVPSQTAFFSNGFDNWSTPYGQFFLNWYSQSLINHGDAILAQASRIFNKTGASIAGKIAGIHWWYMTPSHAAELTAGYYNTINFDGYIPVSTALFFFFFFFFFFFLGILSQSLSNQFCGRSQKCSNSTEPSSTLLAWRCSTAMSQATVPADLRSSLLRPRTMFGTWGWLMEEKTPCLLLARAVTTKSSPSAPGTGISSSPSPT